MPIQDTNKKQCSFKALLGIAALLILVIVLENISGWIPGMPSVLQPTSQLFTVLKKGAVYSLVAVSMNLLNGFTGLFSLGQAGFMLLGAYTFAIFNVPMASKEDGTFQPGFCCSRSSFVLYGRERWPSLPV